MKKRIIALLLAMGMIFCSMAVFAEYTDEKTESWKNPFSDVKEGDWFYKPVRYVNSHDLMKGTEQDKFSPDESLTRGMFVTIIYRLEHEPKAYYATEFDDVKESDYFANAVHWASASAIVNGVSDKLFAPNDLITREQLAAIMYRYAQFNDEGFTGDWMFDLAVKDKDKISEYAYEPICWLVMNNILSGDNGYINPAAVATRAEAAAMILRFVEYMNTPKLEIVNPYEEYDDITEAESAAGVGFPLDMKYIDGFTETGYYVIIDDEGNSILGMKGIYKDKPVELRVSKTLENISGIYGGNPLEDAPVGIRATFSKYQNTAFAEWSKTINNTVYSYSVTIENGDAKELMEFIKSIGVDSV